MAFCCLQFKGHQSDQQSWSAIRLLHYKPSLRESKHENRVYLRPCNFASCLRLMYVHRLSDRTSSAPLVFTICYNDWTGPSSVKRQNWSCGCYKSACVNILQVEYLLHVQELLASHKETLLATGADMQRRFEKHRHKQAKLTNDLSVLRHSFKQAKKVWQAIDIWIPSLHKTAYASNLHYDKSLWNQHTWFTCYKAQILEGWATFTVLFCLADYPYLWDYVTGSK